jgi:hypothetical protein
VPVAVATADVLAAGVRPSPDPPHAAARLAARAIARAKVAAAVWARIDRTVAGAWGTDVSALTGDPRPTIND